MGFKVLIPQDISQAGKNYLLERGYEIKMGSGITEKEIMKDVEDCDAILARTASFTANIIKSGKKLKVIGRHGVGVDNIDIKVAEELGVWVTNAPESNANSVAEHTLGLIIACARNLVRCDKAFRNGDFEIRNKLNGSDLEGKTLGLLGVGRIGTMVAKKAAFGLGMKIIGYDPFLTQDKVIPEIELSSKLEYVLENADFISVHMPAIPSTKGIIGKKEFKMMKSTAYFINCARGEVVNEAELTEALQANEIEGAGLDVFAQEPPARDNPLFQLENVILSPHNAALTKEATMRMALHAAMGIDEVLSGKSPKWPVNNP